MYGTQPKSVATDRNNNELIKNQQSADLWAMKISKSDFHFVHHNQKQAEDQQDFAFKKYSSIMILAHFYFFLYSVYFLKSNQVIRMIRRFFPFK